MPSQIRDNLPLKYKIRQFLPVAARLKLIFFKYLRSLMDHEMLTRVTVGDVEQALEHEGVVGLVLEVAHVVGVLARRQEDLGVRLEAEALDATELDVTFEDRFQRPWQRQSTGDSGGWGEWSICSWATQRDEVAFSRPHLLPVDRDQVHCNAC